MLLGHCEPYTQRLSRTFRDWPRVLFFAASPGEQEEEMSSHVYFGPVKQHGPAVSYMRFRGLKYPKPYTLNSLTLHAEPWDT